MGMAQIGRQHRQPSLDILARAVPAQQRLDREAVPKVVQARTVAGGRAAQSDLARQAIERSMHITDVEMMTATGDEECRGCMACEKGFAVGAVLLQDLQR